MTATSSTMQAAVLHAPRDLRIEARPTPRPGAGEVLVRVSVVGVCGSDLHFYEEGRAGSSVVDRPFVMGHEFGGTIVATGPDVLRHIGERVSVEPGLQCGHCHHCLEGRYNHCSAMHFLGAAPIDGALQEYVVVPSDHAFPIPDEVSDEAAALIEPLSVAMWAITRAGLKAGNSIVIIGAGPIGILCALVAREYKAHRITIIDPVPERRSMAAQITGAAAVAPTDLAEIEMSYDVALECSGSGAGLESAFYAVRPDGHVVVVGVGLDRLDVPMNTIQEGEVHVTGSHRYRHTWPAAIRLAATGKLNLDALVTTRTPFTEAITALTASRTNPATLKVCIHMSTATT